MQGIETLSSLCLLSSLDFTHIPIGPDAFRKIPEYLPTLKALSVDVNLEEMDEHAVFEELASMRRLESLRLAIESKHRGTRVYVSLSLSPPLCVSVPVLCIYWFQTAESL